MQVGQGIKDTSIHSTGTIAPHNR